MSRLRVPIQGLQEGVRELEPEAARYVIRVHRLRPGDRFLAFDPELRLEADAVLVAAARNRATYEVGPVRNATLVAERPLWVLQGVSKGDKLDQIVREATALGATDLVPVTFSRCDAVVSERSEARLRRWERIAVEASRQCGRGDTARIHPYCTMGSALKALPDSALRLCFWEEATTPLRDYGEQIRKAEALVLMIGPEGGLEAEEVREVEGSGFGVVSIGRFILRTETATAAALGAIGVLWGSAQGP